MHLTRLCFWLLAASIEPTALLISICCIRCAFSSNQLLSNRSTQTVTAGTDNSPGSLFMNLMKVECYHSSQ
ncbi:Hypothetical predicted protein [Podarcis lilfordi]|uniref:Secreted protein n=1 Tax=Podarcis lilfordi TaxID=74358 RepID=A0AA35P1L8_9SAUR|nr:Hypothetical predicted protein [Podarcis lilfordi]